MKEGPAVPCPHTHLLTAPLHRSAFSVSTARSASHCHEVLLEIISWKGGLSKSPFRKTLQQKQGRAQSKAASRNLLLAVVKTSTLPLVSPGTVRSVMNYGHFCSVSSDEVDCGREGKRQVFMQCLQQIALVEGGTVHVGAAFRLDIEKTTSRRVVRH